MIEKEEEDEEDDRISKRNKSEERRTYLHHEMLERRFSKGRTKETANNLSLLLSNGDC